MGDQRKRLNAADTATRRAQLLDLVRDGRYTWDQIADQLDYASPGAACTDYKRIVEARREELAQSLDDMRAAQLEGLQELRRVAVEVMRRDHVHVSGGKVVRQELGVEAGADGEPVYELGDPLMDDGPTLAAIDRIAKIDAQIAQLLGLNAPARVEAEGQVRVVIEGIDVT
jgi:hypothetical protein